MKVTTQLNTALVEGIVGLGEELAQITESEAREVFADYLPRIQQDLAYEPEPPDYPVGKFPWKGGIGSAQHKKVMTLLTQAAIARGDYKIGPRGGIQITNLRYERTHDLSGGWQVEVDFSGSRTSLKISNPAAEAPFVYGSLNQRSLEEAAKPQQVFHADRWPLMAERIRYWGDLALGELRERMAQHFGSAVQALAQRRSFR
jgi:hypothetical protein